MDFFEGSPERESVNLAEVRKEGQYMIFSINGAFVPSCSKNHVPGYIELAEELKKQETKDMFCISVNDSFVMAEFGKIQNAEGKIRFLGNPCGNFAKKANLITLIRLDFL